MRACTRLVHLCWRLLGGRGFFHFHLFKRTCTVLCQCLLSLRREVGRAGDGTCRCGRAIDRTWRFVASVLSLCLFHVAETANAKKVPQGLFFGNTKKRAVWFIGGAAVVSPFFLCLFLCCCCWPCELWFMFFPYSSVLCFLQPPCVVFPSV